MDFNKSPKGRFNSLAGEKNNPFSSNREHRNTTPTSSSSGGKYVPPSKRGGKKGRRSERMRLPDVEDRRKAPTPPPDTKDAELFPSLSQSCNSVSVPVEEKKERRRETKLSFAAITTEKEDANKQTKEKEPLKPGWVRLFRGPNGEFMQEHGPPVPESDFFKRMREHEERKARQQLLDTLERNIAYTREMDPYYDDYRQEYDDADDDDEYESDHEYLEEYVSDEDDY